MTVENTATTESSGESYDDFANALQRFRIEAGAPSYTELAQRITRNREARGFSPAAARVARSSVYDVFRLGRKRVNGELVEEIVRALTGDERDVERWRQRALALLNESVKPAGYRSDRAPRADVIPADQRGLVALFTAVLFVTAVGVSLMLNFSVSIFAVPLYLDMVGTAFVSFAFGPLAGIAVGVSTTMVGNLMNGDFSGWWFSLVQITGAVLWGLGFRRWFGRAPWRFFLLNIVVAVACSLVAVPIILYAFGGAALLPGGTSLAASIMELGAGLAGAVFSVNMLTSIADKLISGYLALLFLLLLQRYGFPLAQPVRDRLDFLLPRRPASTP